MGKMSVFCVFAVLIILTLEVYPTVVRNVSLGVNTLSSRLGAMVAPQMILLGVNTTTSVPYAVLSALAMVSGLLTWLLPDTQNKDLSDKLDYATKIYEEKPTEKDYLTLDEHILAYETSI